MTESNWHAIFSMTQNKIESQEEGMPVAFSQEQRQKIQQDLREAAKKMLMDTPYHAIKVEDLSRAAGISKGAFYKFYASKELLFYEILRELHDELFSSAMQTFVDAKGQTADEVLCRTLLICYDEVHTSEYRRFLMKDSREIMAVIPEAEKQAQQEVEVELFHKFFRQFGELAVSEELAIAALNTLILTVYSREKLGADYETILRWMAQGVCSHIFS